MKGFPVPVLLYHHIAPDREVTPKGFEDQLSFLKGEGFSSAGLEELRLHLEGSTPLPDRKVALTFDDGYADNWLCAQPLLAKYGFKAVVFVTTERINAAPVGVRPQNCPSDTTSDERGPSGFLSWEELKLMRESGTFDIGSHTHTHNHFKKTSPWQSMKDELALSRQLIKDKLGFEAESVAWPWGAYEESFIDDAKACGYSMAFTTVPGSNRPGENPMAIRRFKIRNDDTAWLSSRLKLYRSFIGDIYGNCYGLDTRLKNLIRFK